MNKRIILLNENRFNKVFTQAFQNEGFEYLC